MMIPTTRLLRSCLALSLPVLLSACGSLLTDNTASDMVPDGSQLLVKQTLVIPTEKARVYIQHGEVIEAKQRDQYKPYCWMQSWVVAEHPQRIEPATFVIRSSNRYEELVYRRPLMLAANGHGKNEIQLALASVTAIEQKTVLHIHSDNYPDIRQLVCGYWDDPIDDEHLTLAEIRSTLGDVIHIKLAAP